MILIYYMITGIPSRAVKKVVVRTHLTVSNPVVPHNILCKCIYSQYHGC